MSVGIYYIIPLYKGYTILVYESCDKSRKRNYFPGIFFFSVHKASVACENSRKIGKIPKIK
jgi:hypothetical protein